MPASFAQRVINFKNQLFLNPDEREFVRVLKRRTPEPEKLPRLKILMQMPEDGFYLVVFSSIIRSLKNYYSLDIGWIQLHFGFERGGFRNWFRRTQFYFRRWIKLYLANGGKLAYSHLYDEDAIDPQVLKDARKAWNDLETKDDILDLMYGDIRLGDLIYDAYLRYKPAGTIDIKDDYLRKQITAAFDNVVRQKRLFEVEQYDFLFTSYCGYIHHGVMTRSALKYGVKVISFGAYDQLAKRVDVSDPTHSKEYYLYRKWYAALTEAEQALGRDEAKKQLAIRFQGKVDGPTSYMAQSAYHSEAPEAFKVFTENGKKRVIVFLHCFFDSPHIFRYMFYADFYDWVVRTLELLSGTDYEVYVKPHPNGLPENNAIVDEILSRFPRVKQIDKTVSNLNLIREGFDLAVTVYGTLGHEFPFFGIPVLNAGDNPHINYNFCVHPKSREEYEYLLTHVNQIPVPNPAFQDEIAEFYFMHNLYFAKGRLNMQENTTFTAFRYADGPKRISYYVHHSRNENYSKRFDELAFRSVKDLL